VSNVGVNTVSLVWPKVVSTQRVSNYVLDVSLDGNTWISVGKKVSSSSSIALAGLRPGRTYQVRVAAVNTSGQGTYRLGSFTTLPALSTAPRTLTFSSVTASGFTVNWVAPASDGGAVISDYVVEVKGGGSDWVQVAKPASNLTSATVSGLKPAVRYAVRVKAVNQVGVSASSSAFNVVTAALAPSAPVVAVKSMVGNALALSWQVSNDGGARVNDYLVEYSLDNGQTWLKVIKPVSTSKTLVLRGVKAQTKYLFKVTAINRAGLSPESQVLEVTLP
jgi:hypothetical protein